MDTLSTVIISAMAVSFIIELISSLTGKLFSPRIIKLTLNLPLSYAAVWYMGLTGFPLIVSGLAVAFASLALLLLISPPIQVINNLRR